MAIPDVIHSESHAVGARSGNPTHKSRRFVPEGPMTLPSLPSTTPPRRLRRLNRIWPDRDGTISYLLTVCVQGREHVLDNELTFQLLVSFLLESPQRYRWYGRRFVIMPDHIHLIAHMGLDAVRLGQWMKALKAFVGRLHAIIPYSDAISPSPPRQTENICMRNKRTWRWQASFHDHKFRTRESEGRKWEYVCLNPVRAGLVSLPEQWLFSGEIIYNEAGGPRLIRGTPELLKRGILG